VQSNELSATAATIEEITVSINHIADNAGETEVLVASTRENSEDSYQAMEKWQRGAVHRADGGCPAKRHG
jgi:methyl-accepting chemotaxis protein